MIFPTLPHLAAPHGAADQQEDADDADLSDDDRNIVGTSANVATGRRRVIEEELCEMAKFVASFTKNEWDSMSKNHRWDNFAKTVRFLQSYCAPN